MSKKASKQFSKAFETIETLKASNRKAFIKILAAMAVVLLLASDALPSTCTASFHPSRLAQ